MSNPILLAAENKNNIYDMPHFLPCAAAGNKIFIISPEDLMPLPPSSELFVLPERKPVGYNIEKKLFQVLPEYNAVAAFIPPGYTQLFNAAYTEDKNAKLLPLFSYAPLVLYKNKYHMPAIQIDKRKVHDIRFMDTKKVQQKISKTGKTKNRIIEHLKNCALTYKCPNALNFFL